MKYRYLLYFFLLGLTYSDAQTLSVSASTKSGCGPLLVDFWSNAPQGATYLWEFGNGNTSTAEKPSASYITAGNYDVKLTITYNGITNIKEEKKFITVFAKPIADFTVHTSSGCVPLQSSVSDNSRNGSGIINSWSWDFGKGFSTTGKNASIVLSQTGTYNITLSVKDNNGCTDLIKKNTQIEVFPTPEAVFTHTGNTVCSAPAVVNFQNKSAGKNTIQTYDWNFGNGLNSTKKDDVSTYHTGGKFDVTLTVTDIKGCTSTRTKSVDITIGAPTVNFDYPDIICTNNVAKFVNKTSYPDNSLYYVWEFSSAVGTTAFSDKDVEISFAKAGQYQVKLKASTAANCITETTKTIEVHKAPEIDFSSKDLNSCSAPLKVNLKLNSGELSTWYWNVNGLRIAEKDTAFTISKVGTHTVTLVFTATNGCTGIVGKTGYIIIEKPTAIILTKDTSECVPFQLNLTQAASSPFGIASVKWDFGDGKTNSDLAPIHSFNDTGKFTVQLEVTDKLGCKTYDQIIVKGGKKPSPPDFVADRTQGCTGELVVNFTAIPGSGGVTPDLYEWDFGAKGLLANYSYAKRNPGQYNVSLSASHNGCKATTTKNKFITVIGSKARLQIQADPCIRDSVKFINQSENFHVSRWQFLNDVDSILYDTLTPEPKSMVPQQDFYARLIVYDTVLNCSDTFKTLVVLPKPLIADFSVVDKSCAPKKIKFQNKSLGASRYLWTLSDGRTFTDFEPEINFTAVRFYHITLKVTNDQGCSAEIKKNNALTLYNHFVASNQKDTTLCAPGKIALVDHSYPWYTDSKKWWDLGNGETIQVIADTMYHTFEKSELQSKGTTVQLIIDNPYSCLKSNPFTVRALRPDAHIAAESIPSCVYPEYKFYRESSTGINPIKYQWQIGSQKNSGDTLHYQFKKEGKQKIILDVSDSLNCKNIDTLELDISLKKLKADFETKTIIQNCPPLYETFTNKSNEAYAPITEYLWTFGDGDSSSLVNPGKIYGSPGTYTVSLEITDAFGCKDKKTYKNLVTLGGPIGTFILSNEAGCVPHPVHFNTMTNESYSVKWDAGDGTIITGKKVQHTYTDTGTFSPIVYLSDTNGCAYGIDLKKTIQSKPLPQADFTFDSVCSNIPVNFTNLSRFPGNNEIKKSIWFYGDETTDTAIHSKHTFKSPGTYNAKLRVTAANGCENTLEKDVLVYGLKLTLQSTDSFGCVGLPVYFNCSAQSFGAEVQHVRWNFGDGSRDSSTQLNNAHTFFQKGKYTITISVITDKACVEETAITGLVIGDTLKPEHPNIRYVTVTENSVHGAYEAGDDIDLLSVSVFRKSESAFEKISESVRETSFFDIAVTTNSSRYSYFLRSKNICGHYSLPSPIHSTILLRAIPDTNKIYLNWNAYEGWDAESYIVERYSNEKNDFETIGVCTATEFADTQTTCHRKHSYRIRANAQHKKDVFSISNTAATAAIHIAKVPVPIIQNISVINPDMILTEWKAPENSRYAIKNVLIQRSTDSISYENVKTIETHATTYNDRIRNGHYSFYYRAQFTDSCGDKSAFSIPVKTTHLSVHFNSESDYPELNWNAYTAWKRQVAEYIIYREEDGNFVPVAAVSGNTTQFTDTEVSLNGRKNYSYKIAAIHPDKKTISYSDVATATGKAIVHIPNAFTPNADDLNSHFGIEGHFIYSYELQIYNRWGALVFDSNESTKNWDGRTKNEDAPEGIYTYVLRVKSADNSIQNYNGIIHLIR